MQQTVHQSRPTTAACLSSHKQPNKLRMPKIGIKDPSTVDMIAGLVAGTVSTLVSFPADTVKVGLQTAGAHQQNTLRHCVRKIYRSGGVRNNSVDQ